MNCGWPMEMDLIYFKIYSSPWDLSYNGPSKVCRPAHLPCFHRMRHRVSIWGKRGKTAWDTWNVYPEVTEAFEELTKMHGNLTEKAQSQIERFVILMYDRTSDVLEINKARKELFTKKSRSLENLPPTQAALKEHTKRASLQGQSRIKATELDQPLPNPGDFGWSKDQDGWQPVWTTLPQAQQSCYELIQCSCRRACSGRCKCAKAALKCSELCACSGDC